jgi:hypothetical protein
MSEYITQRMREHQRLQATHVAEDRPPVIGLDEARYALSRRGMADIVKGRVAGFVGLPGDILSNYTPPGWEAELGGDPDLAYQVSARLADYTSNVDPKDQPFTTEWFGERFGADTSRLAFQGGTFLDPKAPIKGLIGMAGGLAGMRAANNMLGKAGTTIRHAHREAVKLFEAGESPQTIWEKTNWIMDPDDGQWKFQIPVEKSKINWEYLEHAFDHLETDKVKLGDFLDNRLLFASYPQLKNVDISWDIFNFGAPNEKGFADFNRDLIKIFAMNKDEFHSTLVHEVEHFIQAYENFPTGGQPTKEIFGSLLRNVNEANTALAMNRYQRLLYKNLLDLPQEVKSDPDTLTNELVGMLATMRGEAREAVEITANESVILTNIINDAREYARTGRYLSTERAVINLGLKGSILEQRAALFEGMADNAKTLGLSPEQENDLIASNFYTEYKRLAGEVNARLAQYDLKMSRGTVAQQRWLRETNPINRRRRMLEEEGLPEEHVSILNVSDPNALSYADWYGGQLQQKAALLELQEAIKGHINANTKP